ncbi:MAG: DUF433 domain-containing protein [Cytophagaceae bacterium]|nr:DUF433 domain-containing protein [Cytophagaceae bacterium]
MNWQDHITSDPAILYGKPIVKGTRIGVDLILEKLANDESVGQLLHAYPPLTEEHIRACLLSLSQPVLPIAGRICN